MSALQAKKTPNSPRKTSITTTPAIPLETLISLKEITVSEIATNESEDIKSTDLPEYQIPAEIMTRPSIVDDDRVEALQSELKILKLEKSELERKVQLAKDRDALEAEAKEVLIETQTQLFLLQDQLHELRAQRDLERLERNSQQVAFDQERAVFEETIAQLKGEQSKITELQAERDWLQEALDRATKERELLELKLADATALEQKISQLESLNTRLLSSLKKGQQVREVLYVFYLITLLVHFQSIRTNQRIGKYGLPVTTM